MEQFQHSSATYFNRELSLFEFQRRVLAQALDTIYRFRALKLPDYFSP